MFSALSLDKAIHRSAGEVSSTVDSSTSETTVSKLGQIKVNSSRLLGLAEARMKFIPDGISVFTGGTESAGTPFGGGEFFDELCFERLCLNDHHLRDPVTGFYCECNG